MNRSLSAWILEMMLLRISESCLKAAVTSLSNVIFAVKARKHGWESDKKNGGVSVRVEFMVDTDILKNKKLYNVDLCRKAWTNQIIYDIINHNVMTSTSHCDF